MNLETTVKKASQILKNHNVLSHELDAQIILSEIMGIKREFLITNNHINIFLRSHNFELFPYCTSKNSKAVHRKEYEHKT